MRLLVEWAGAVAVRCSATCSKAGDGRECPSENRLARRESATQAAFSNFQLAAGARSRGESTGWPSAGPPSARSSRDVDTEASPVRRFGSGVRSYERSGPTSRVGDVEHGERSSLPSESPRRPERYFRSKRIEEIDSSRDTFASRSHRLPPRPCAEREVTTPRAAIAANFPVAANLGEPQTPLERARTLVNPYAGRTSLSALVSVRKVVRWSLEVGRKYPTFENLARPPPRRRPGCWLADELRANFRQFTLQVVFDSARKAQPFRMSRYFFGLRDRQPSDDGF